MDFTMQLEEAMEAGGITSAMLAGRMGISESRVSQVLNGQANISMKTALRFANAVGLDFAPVLYKMGEQPVFAGVFWKCWEECGQPRDFFRWHKDEEVG